MRSIFSGIVIFSVAAYVAWFFMPYIWEYLYDYETLGGLQWAGYGSKINLNGPIPYLIACVYLVSSLGLLFYKSWARSLFLVLTIFNIVSAPLWGLNVQGGYDAIIRYIVTLCDGAILALAYLSGISSEFKSNT